MFLEINFKSNNVFELKIKKGSKVIDQADFEFNRNLEQILIYTLDKILNRNRMPLLSLRAIRITGGALRDTLSCQIAQSFKKALNL